MFNYHSLIPWDHFGVDKKKSGDHFGVGIISGSIWGSFQGWGSFRGRDHFRGCTDLGLENAALDLRPLAAFSRPRSRFNTIRTSQPANNIYSFRK